MSSSANDTPDFESLVEVFEYAIKRFSTNELFGEKKNGLWTWMTYARFGQRVDDVRGGLAAAGVRPGDRVAVIANNRSEWAIGAYASYTLGAAYVPMYEAQHDKEWEFILKDSSARVVFVANAAIAARVTKMRDKLPQLEHVIRFDGTESEKDTFASLLRLGAETPAPILRPKPDDLGGLIYTSGTTGNPKGVMLSQRNFAKNVWAIHQNFPMAQNDRSLSFLPWAHSFGQTVELHGLFSMGASIAISESVDKLMDNLGETKPTLLFSVPRIFNRIYDGLQKRMANEKPYKRRLFQHAMKVAARRRELADRGLRDMLIDAQYRVLDRIISQNVRARFGGRLKYAFSGGAAISREVAEFIDNLGITVYEGYGLTETSPIFTSNYPANRKIGSVGKAIPGTWIEIDKSANPTEDPNQGEIVAHGHNVMMGYYNLPDENAKAFTGDGGFRTGDLGYVDSDGYLFITGRVKEQYKLENGKYVAPSPIEEKLTLSPYIANAMVHGMNKPFNVAIIVADVPALKAWATERGLPTDSLPELFKRREVQELYGSEIATHAKGVKGYERPQRFVLISEDFTTENDMLTQSLKVKRRNVITRYNEAIENLYREAAQAGASAA